MKINKSEINVNEDIDVPDCCRTVQTIERYGKQGLIVSVAFGPCGNYGDQYSVTVMDPKTGKEFNKPFGASSFGDIAMILDIKVPAMQSEI